MQLNHLIIGDYCISILWNNLICDWGSQQTLTDFPEHKLQYLLQFATEVPTENAEDGVDEELLVSTGKDLY